MISSLGEEEIVFPNYNQNRSKESFRRESTRRLAGSVEESALNLCAALAGSEHGDARRAIDLIPCSRRDCRTAAVRPRYSRQCPGGLPKNRGEQGGGITQILPTTRKTTNSGNNKGERIEYWRDIRLLQKPLQGCREGQPHPETNHPNVK